MSQSIEAFKNSLKIPELKQRIIFTLILLAIYRFGCHIPTPGVVGGALAERLQQQGGLLSFYDMFTGGAFQNATIFALGIMPYISASIIMQLLTSVIPTLEKLAKEGAEGYKKINQYTRYGTIGLCLIQSFGYSHYLQILSADNPTNPIVVNPGFEFYFISMLSFTTGAAFIMWIGEQISEHGVGNGISLLIFISIVSDIPTAIFRLLSLVRNGEITPIRALFLVAVLVVVVAAAIYITTGQRRIPVQYPRQVKGRKMYGGTRSYLPLRVNQAGVIPIIFASAILTLPMWIGSSVRYETIYRFFATHFDQDSLAYNVLYGALIVFFCFFYTAITFNPVEMADNMKKYGGVIMGVRPGRATAEHLNYVMTRITLVGSLLLTGVALFPTVVTVFLEVRDYIISRLFGGTSLLILVGVALDTLRQIEQHLVMRHYDGFTKGGRIRARRF